MEKAQLTPLYIPLRNIEKESGFDKDAVLSLAVAGKIRLCVLLGGDAKNEKAYFLRLGFDESLEDFEKAFPDAKKEPLSQFRVFDNGFARVVFNPDPKTGISPTADVKGLFELRTATITNLVNGNEVTDGKMVMISPYGGEMFLWLWAEFFGDDPLSKLVIPAEELEKLIEASHPAEDAGKPAVSEKQDVPNQKGTGSKVKESGAARMEVNNEILLGMLFHAISERPGLQKSLLDRIREMFNSKSEDRQDSNENSRSKIDKRIPEWKRSVTKFRNEEDKYWKNKDRK